MYLLNIEKGIDCVKIVPNIKKRGLFRDRETSEIYISLKELKMVKENSELEKVENEEKFEEISIDTLKREGKSFDVSNRLKTIINGYSLNIRETISPIKVYQDLGYQNLEELYKKEQDLKRRSKSANYTLRSVH